MSEWIVAESGMLVCELVRCNDCKWFKEFTDNGNPTGRGSCENDKLDMFHSPRVDWFCADEKEQDDERHRDYWRDSV